MPQLAPVYSVAGLEKSRGKNFATAGQQYNQHQTEKPFSPIIETHNSTCPILPDRTAMPDGDFFN
jgi:hypothetical protein